MKVWERDILQEKVLPALYRAKNYLCRDKYDYAYNEIEEAIAIIVNRLLPELDLIDLNQIQILSITQDNKNE